MSIKSRWTNEHSGIYDGYFRIENVYIVKKNKELLKLNSNEINQFAVFDLDNLSISYDYSHAFD